MSNTKDLLGPMRLPFVILTPACVLLGVGTAFKATGHIDVFHLILLFIGAISAHISVNSFNEYFDFKSGLDFKTDRTPFSGGSGTLPEKPVLSRQTLFTAVTALLITLFAGLYLVYVSGLFLLPLGILGLFLVFSYTPWIVRNPFLCLIAPGLGFGTIMVMGAHFVLTSGYSLTAFLASLVPFFLVSNLLLLSQFPDVEADKATGRKHFPIVIGRRKSSIIYCAFLLLAYMVIICGVCFHYLPGLSLIGLGTIALAVPAGIGAYRHADNIKKLIPYMVMNVLINIATPVLVAIGFFF